MLGTLVHSTVNLLAGDFSCCFQWAWCASLVYHRAECGLTAHSLGHTQQRSSPGELDLRVLQASRHVSRSCLFAQGPRFFKVLSILVYLLPLFPPLFSWSLSLP